MPGPFDSAAFAPSMEPFFDASVKIEGLREGGAAVRGTFAACIFPVSSDEPISAELSDSTARLVTILVARAGRLAWNRPEPPQQGDSVTLQDGSRWSVRNVEAFDSSHYTLTCRSS